MKRKTTGDHGLTTSSAGKTAAFIIVAGTIVSAGLTAAGFVFAESYEAQPARGFAQRFAETLEREARVTFPKANREIKQDRLGALVKIDQASPLQPVSYELASATPQDRVETPAAAPTTQIPVTAAAAEPVVRPKPAPPAPPKLPSAAMLRDNQIATIKERLKLTASQEAYWPAVETALRGVLREVYEAKKRGDANIDANNAEVQKLKYAAMPLLLQMREEQKREVRQLAHVIGLADVASMI